MHHSELDRLSWELRPLTSGSHFKTKIMSP
jgi:hypothetical protein